MAAAACVIVWSECTGYCGARPRWFEPVAVIAAVIEQLACLRQDGWQQCGTVMVAALFSRSAASRWVCPCRHRPCAVWNSGRLWCGQYVENPLLQQTAGRAVRLEGSGVNHQPLGRTAPGGNRGEDADEHTETAPSDEAVVERLRRSVA
jgi:ferredoxin-thioredoxin reductase catalytic subunit